MPSSIILKGQGHAEAILDLEDHDPIGSYGDMFEEMWPKAGEISVRWRAAGKLVFAPLVFSDLHMCDIQLGHRDGGSIHIEERPAVFGWHDGAPGFIVFYAVLNDPPEFPVYRWVLPKP